MKKIIVIAGPSGSGKNAVIGAILKHNSNFTRLVTATTRAPRPGEQEGVDYYFLSQEKFDAELAAGNIPEHRFVPELDTYYGVYLPDLKKKIQEGKIVFAQVDIEGARLLKERFGAITIFILPESLEQFRARLRVRNPEWSKKEFDARMRITEEEMRVHAPQYDYRVTNADGKLEDTTSQVMDIMRREGYTFQS